MNPKGKGNDNFRTPAYIFNQLDKIFNFQIDIACTRSNCLCPKGFYFDEGKNALIENWNGRAFCNPPFSKKSEFIEKAHKEVISGKCPICVMILPILSMDTIAWHKYIEDIFKYEILKGRISFVDPETLQPKSGNNCGSVIVYFKKKIHIKEQE